MSHILLRRAGVADCEAQHVAAVELRVRDEDLARGVDALEDLLIVGVRAVPPKDHEGEAPRGGELKGMTKALTDSREQVRQRMIEEAETHGANAIIAMRFDTSEMGGNWTEICAYGTAVKVHKV